MCSGSFNVSWMRHEGAPESRTNILYPAVSRSKENKMLQVLEPRASNTAALPLMKGKWSYASSVMNRS
jgi:hypothetical protein